MPEVRNIITAEAKAKKEEEARKKKLGHVETKALPSEGYSRTQVADIVSRMKGRYDARGYGKDKGKGAELKKKISGTKAISLDQRSPSELVLAKGGYARLVGRIYTALPFMNALTDRASSYSLAMSIPRDLGKANMNYSSKQYVSMAVVAAIAATGFAALLLLALVLTVLSGSVAQIAMDLASPSTPLVAMVIAQGVNAGLVLTLTTYFLSFGGTFLLSFAFFIVILLVAFQWPSSIASKRGKSIDKELPFALRHMATEIRAGIGIYKTMKSIVEAGYGELSVEFERTIRDIDKGMSTDEALISMSERSPSEGLGRAVMHITRTLKTGGNLSSIIETIASEVAFDLRMKMRDFVERLNLIGLFYMMAGIVFPVFVAVLAGIFNSIPTIGLAGALGTEALFLLYFILIPMILSLILYVIKVMQPM